MTFNDEKYESLYAQLTVDEYKHVQLVLLGLVDARHLQVALVAALEESLARPLPMVNRDPYENTRYVLRDLIDGIVCNLEAAAKAAARAPHIQAMEQVLAKRKPATTVADEAIAKVATSGGEAAA